MTLSPWKLNGRLAELHSDQLSAQVDLTRPAVGASHLHLAGRPLNGIHLLGVAMPPRLTGEPHPIEDAFVRSADLSATYAAREDWPVRVAATWRGVSRPSDPEFVAAIELLLSVRTDSLDAHPRISVESAFSGGQVALAADPNADRFEPFVSSAADSASTGPGAQAGCIVFRPTASEFSYVEMVHPADSQGDELLGGGDTPFRVRHRLFDESLERGVVLCARLRGVFVPRERDTQLASQRYAAFRASPPPLAT